MTPVTRCQERVWDNGDTTDCGAPARHAGLCERHLDAERKTTANAIKACRAKLEGLELRLAEISAAKGKLEMTISQAGDDGHVMMYDPMPHTKPYDRYTCTQCWRPVIGNWDYVHSLLEEGPCTVGRRVSEVEENEPKGEQTR